MTSAPDDRRTLTTGRVVFLVIAAAAPMAAMIGNVPLALIRGNGAGLPAAFLLSSVVLLCFSVGFSAISQQVFNTGAFYTYVGLALGKPPGVAAAYVAVVAYMSLACGLSAAFGYFTRLVLLDSGIDIPWYVFTAVSIAIVATLGFRNADLSAKVLGVLMALEFAFLTLFDLLVVSNKGSAALPLESFTPTQVFSGSLGIAMMFAFSSFIGFESAALYGEETKDPRRSIPRATYIAVSVIAVFYVLTSWIIVGAAGGANASDLARTELGNLLFTLAREYGGVVLYDGTAILLCTSVLASYLALHNAASRYLFAMGYERVLPSTLGRFHPKHFSPHIGSMTVTAITAVVIAVFAIAGSDPYLVVAAGAIGLGTLGIIALQASTALSVVVFFWNRDDGSLWRTKIAPTIGFIGLASGLVLAGIHYSTLTGSDSAVVNAIPVVLILVALAGVVVALRIRHVSPERYKSVAAATLRTPNT
ncbi:amino acid permease [Rhodococcoides trifolii]|uniref:Amino acid permease n=1 Tax=Rhodococcoides trifolii TaxID=908250 RepID=A0A917G465_9NOCA|nr:APC family permease [Rhodococcus trifolii]GGG21862.1 amino acid permease [Rhodococcus trifolii]